jgi:hypothetical protein
MRASGSGQRTLRIVVAGEHELPAAQDRELYPDCRPSDLRRRPSCYEASMTLARLTEVLAPAAAFGTGLGAFNVFSIEHTEAFTAAEAAGTVLFGLRYRCPWSCTAHPAYLTKSWYERSSPA